jgi:signal transduction histidine kinase
LAISTFILVIVGLFLSFYFYRINQLKVQKVLLEKLVAERTNDLKLTNEQLLEHQIQIENQAEELQIQSENLKETNNLLIAKQQLIINQTEQLKETNNKLSLLNATKDKFFSIIAHDLKNPFNAILGLSEILIIKYDSIDDEERKNLLRMVNESSNNIYRLLENLLEWAHSQTGSINYQPEEFVINEMIISNIALVKNMALKKDIQIINNFEDKVKIFADKNMINTVLRNLISNAIKFTESGSIKIDVTKGSNSTTILVKDSGMGISSDKLNKIFDLLSAKSTSGTKVESGTVLCLILCKEFV